MEKEKETRKVERGLGSSKSLMRKEERRQDEVPAQKEVEDSRRA